MTFCVWLPWHDVFEAHPFSSTNQSFFAEYSVVNTSHFVDPLISSWTLGAPLWAVRTVLPRAALNTFSCERVFSSLKEWNGWGPGHLEVRVLRDPHSVSPTASPAYMPTGRGRAYGADVSTSSLLVWIDEKSHLTSFQIALDYLNFIEVLSIILNLPEIDTAIIFPYFY